MLAFKIELARIVATTPLFESVGLSEDSLISMFSTPPKAELGDLSLPAFVFAKALKVKPPEAATKLKEAIEEEGAPFCEEVRLVGPYVNFFIKHEALAAMVIEGVNTSSPTQDPEEWCYGENYHGKGRTVAFDLSSPNIAKPLAVHHLRSTMIGNSLKKIYEANGWRAVGVNHLGDWGTNFGKIISGLCEEYPEVAKELEEQRYDKAKVNAFFSEMSIADLNKVYVKFSKRVEENPELESVGKAEFKALESALESNLKGDDEDVRHMRRNFRLWEHIKEVSLHEYEVVYGLLGVKFVPFPIVFPEFKKLYEEDEDAFFRKYSLYTGESYFVAASQLCQQIIEESKSKGLAEESDGALVIFPEKDQPPLMLLKDDGATSYHTRDLAAARYRREHFGADKGIYVVDARQSLHFNHLFRVLEMLGDEWGGQCKHVEFGIMLGKDEESGKWGIFSTRKGKLLLLHDLLTDAIEAVKKIVAEKNPELAKDSEALNEIATNVGVGAVVFHDLKHGRRADVKFDWDEVLSFSGETGPYMLYQYVRLGSVMRKYVEKYGESEAEPNYALLEHGHERELLKSIAAFPEVVSRACRENEPSVISRYLLDISALFSSYWTATKDSGIVSDDADLSRARIALVDVLRKVLAKGLMLLGLRLVEKM